MVQFFFVFLLGALGTGKRELSLGMLICTYCPHCNDTKLAEKQIMLLHTECKNCVDVQETCQTCLSLPHEWKQTTDPNKHLVKLSITAEQSAAVREEVKHVACVYSWRKHHLSIHSKREKNHPYVRFMPTNYLHIIHLRGYNIADVIKHQSEAALPQLQHNVLSVTTAKCLITSP